MQSLQKPKKNIQRRPHAVPAPAPAASCLLVQLQGSFFLMLYCGVHRQIIIIIMIIIMPFCGVYRRFGFVFCYTRPPRFHEQHFPSSCEENDQTDKTRAGWNRRRAEWEEYYANINPRNAKQLSPHEIPKSAPPKRPDTMRFGFADRSNSARDKDFRNKFRQGFQEIAPFLVIAVFTARLC
jgi:hypothetical protein